MTDGIGRELQTAHCERAVILAVVGGADGDVAAGDIGACRRRRNIDAVDVDAGDSANVDRAAERVELGSPADAKHFLCGHGHAAGDVDATAAPRVD